MDVDVERTRAFAEAIVARLDAEEFEELMVGEPADADRQRPFWRGIDRLAARHLLFFVDGIEEMSALDQLRFRRTLDELAGKYPGIAS